MEGDYVGTSCVFPVFSCLREQGHELLLLSVVVVCLGQVTSTFGLGGLDGVTLMQMWGRERAAQKRLFLRWLFSREISVSHSQLLLGLAKYFTENRKQSTKENLP